MPRRLRRFHRKKGKEEKKVVERLHGIPEKKQEGFTKKLKIEKDSPDKIAESIFEQLEKKEHKRTGEKKETKTGKKEIPLWQKKRNERMKKEGKEKNKKETTKSTIRKCK